MVGMLMIGIGLAALVSAERAAPARPEGAPPAGATAVIVMLRGIIAFAGALR
jgi:hypothetical protein